MSSFWPMVPLGQLLTRRKDEVSIEELTVYPRLTVRLNGRGIVIRDKVPGSLIGTKKQFIARTGQLVLSKIDARNGAFGILPQDGDLAIITGNFWAFDHRPDRLELRFLDYLTKTAAFVDFCVRASEGTTNRRYLQEEKFLAQEMPLPSLTEQRRLVERIDALAAKIDDVKKLRNELTEETAALTKAARRGVFTDLQADSTPLNDVCTVVIDCLHSNPIYADDGVPTLRSPDVGWGDLYLSSARKTGEAEYRRRTSRGEPAPGDIIVVREGGGTGKAGIVEEGQRFSLGQRVMMLRPDRDKIDPKYLLYQWLSPLIYEDQIVSGMKGSASPHLNIGAAKTFRVCLPPLSRQRQIVAYLDGLRAKADELCRIQAGATEELQAMMPAILDRAFRGEL